MTYTINGHVIEAQWPMLTYEKIAKMVGLTYPVVTYRIPSTGQEGRLLNGDVIGISPGLIITAVMP